MRRLLLASIALSLTVVAFAGSAMAGGSGGVTGPNLDEVLPGQTEAMVHESIADPNKKIATGYPPNVMPGNFEQKLSPKELEDLVKYLVESTSGDKGGSKKSG